MRTHQRRNGLPVWLLAVVVLVSLPATLRAQNSTRVYEKLERIVLPSLELENASLPEAVDRIRQLSRELDTLETNPDRKGIRIGFEKMRGDEPQRHITLSLQNVVLSDALDEICKASGRRFDVFEDGVVLRRAPMELPGMVTRRIPVPPDFLSVGYDDSEAADDPFAPPSPTAPKKRKTAEEILEMQGITFPQGAFARYSVRDSMLVVRNTLANFDLIEAYTMSIGEGPRPQITVRAELYSVERPLALELLARFDGESGAHRLVAAVREATEKGTAQLLALPSIKTRSGQRAKIETGTEYEYISGYEVKDDKETAISESLFVGTEFEIDPVAGYSGEVDLNLAFSRSLGVPEFRKGTVITPVSGKEAAIESAQFPVGTVSTAISLMDGQPAYVGTLEGIAEDGRLHMLFVTATVNYASFGPVVPE